MLALTGTRTRGEQGGPLQLGPSRSDWKSSLPVAVRFERRRSNRVFGEEIRPYHAAASRTALVEGSGEDLQYRLCVLAYRCLHNTAPSYLSESLCHVA